MDTLKKPHADLTASFIPSLSSSSPTSSSSSSSSLLLLSSSSLRKSAITRTTRRTTTTTTAAAKAMTSHASQNNKNNNNNNNNNKTTLLHAITRITIAFHLLFILATSFFMPGVTGNDNLRVAYEWNEIDFKYASRDERWTALQTRAFKPNNVIPFGLEVYRSRLFVTLPRWRDGVPASLAYLDLNDNTTKSPALTPFPSWEAHSLNEADPELISPFRVRADRCGRLWVLDSRISDVLGKTTVHGPAQLLVYDLHNDNLLQRHIFPRDQMKQNSIFANLAVEDAHCERTYAYAADMGNPGLVVYSWQERESWRVQHNYFHPDPLAGNFSIDGIEFQWDNGLYGLAISKAAATAPATLYFHPMTSTMEFAVNTAILRNKSVATSREIYSEFKILGSRGPNAQAGASFLDQLTGVLFYALPNLNAVACWKTSNRAYTIKSQGRVYMSSVEMVFPSDVKVDDQDRLWVLSNRLHEFIYDEMLPTTVNFRILTAHVKDAIENTACDIRSKPLPELINKLGDILNNVTNSTLRTVKSGAGATTELRSVFVVVVSMATVAAIGAGLTWLSVSLGQY